MSEKSEIQKLIETQIKPQTEALVKEHKTLHDLVIKLMTKVEEAIVKEDVDTLKLMLKALTVETGKMSVEVSRAGRLLQILEEAETDEDMEEDLKEIEHWTETLSGQKTQMENNFIAGKSIMDSATKKLAELSKGEKVAAEAWAANEAWFRKHLELGKARLKEIQGLSDKAGKAADGRDDDGLKAALKRGLELRDYKPTVEELEGTLKKLPDDVDVKSLGEDLQAQFARDAASYKKMLDELATVSDKIAEIYAGMEKLEIKPLDIKKAAALLKLPSAAEAKLKKAMDLDGSALEKALDALAKEFKLKTTGKDMAAALKKAKFV